MDLKIVNNVICTVATATNTNRREYNQWGKHFSLASFENFRGVALILKFLFAANVALRSSRNADAVILNIV